MNISQLKSTLDGTVLTDDEVPGLQFHARDGRRAFFFYYRNQAGQRRRPKIGDFPEITLSQARTIAKAWLADVIQGGDPSGRKGVLRASETVADLCDRYLAEHPHKASARHDRGHVKRILKPLWGSTKAMQIKGEDLAKLKRSMKAKPVAFNRVQSLISSMWKFGGYELVPVKKNKEAPRQRYMTVEERVRFLAALDKYEAQYPHAIALIRILDFTGARLSEISKAKRSQYRDGELYLTQHKTAATQGPKVIVFPPGAQAVLAGLTPRKDLLVGFSSYPNIAWDLVRSDADLENFTLHDLRHSFASDALSNGATLGEIGEVLGHRDFATTKRYAHLASAGKRKVTDAVEKSRSTTK